MKHRKFKITKLPVENKQENKVLEDNYLEVVRKIIKEIAARIKGKV